MEKTVYIFGHKNPDTDSGVAAAAYARLKQLQGFPNHVAARAGHFAPQTEYIFKKFNVPYPKYIPDLIPKVQYYMPPKADTVKGSRSVWDAIGKMEDAESRALPVVDENGSYHSLLHYSIFAQNILTVMNPEHKTAIPTSIGLIQRTINAQPIHVANEDEIFRATVLVGAASEEEFKKTLAEHASENIIVITSDREAIHAACIAARIKLLIITSGYVLKKELRDQAAVSGVSVIMSPHSTSSTAMLIAYSTPVSVMADTDIPTVRLTDPITKVRPLLQNSPCRCLPVTDDNGKALGVISEHDLTNEPNIEIILVDHNEMSQAVEGVEQYKLREVIDHHRLGTLNTAYPITFINKPVGATSTLITQLYQESRIPIPKDIASILLCGILSDTLILQSTTATDADRAAAEYLANIADLDIQTLGREILTAGSHLEGRTVNEVIHQDMKEYREDKAVYTVSQIEVGNLAEILDRKDEFLQELEAERRACKGIFSALLVTDITQLSSILLLKADEKFQPFVTFPRLEEDVYFLKDVVSRKKQLIPLISEQVENSGL
ncbi:MAG: putative manganese-dependent inorganic diphosphatase [Treponemataceae bacterium]|nr:putative manganese-dependent inorganic diphosphatase [Treponemataceae bacterium]